MGQQILEILFHAILALIAATPLWVWLVARSAERTMDAIVADCRRSGAPLPWTPAGRAYWQASER